VAAFVSDLVVTVHPSGKPGERVTGKLSASPGTSGLPPAVWRAVPPGQTTPALATGVDLVTGCTSVGLAARSGVVEVGGSAVLSPDEVEQDRSRRKPLPFLSERTARPDTHEAASIAVRADVTAESQAAIARQVTRWLARGTAPAGRIGVRNDGDASGDGADAERLRLLRRRSRQWQALPRPVRITEGLGPPDEEPVPLQERPAPPPAPQVDRTVGQPVVLALLDAAVAAAHRGGQTTVTTLRKRGADAARQLPRRVAPSPDLARAADRAVAARLLLAGSVLERTGKTIRPAGAAVRTGQVGGAREVRRLPAPDAATRTTIGRSQKALLSEAGISIVPGQALVLGLPNSSDDADPARPALRVAGTAAVRVVALDVSGRPLADVTLDDGDVTVPAGTAALGLLGVGVGATHASGLAGWTAGQRVFSILPGSALAPGAVVTGPATPRREEVAMPAAAGAALAPCREVVSGVGAVETTLPASIRTLLVALDRRSGTGVEGLVLGLSGLRRRVGRNGVLPPAAVTSGRRTVLAYPVAADPTALREAQETAATVGRTRPPDTATVTVASDERWELAGVLGSPAAADSLARDVLAGGVDALLAPLIGASVGSAAVRWVPGGRR
jgi:hypothetical protein